jgi:hypothetical protein
LYTLPEDGILFAIAVADVVTARTSVLPLIVVTPTILGAAIYFTSYYPKTIAIAMAFPVEVNPLLPLILFPLIIIVSVSAEIVIFGPLVLPVPRVRLSVLLAVSTFDTLSVDIMLLPF